MTDLSEHHRPAAEAADGSSDDAALALSQATRRWIEEPDLEAALYDLLYTTCRLVPCRSAAIGVTRHVPTGRPVAVRAASDAEQFAVLLDIVARVPHSPGVLAAEQLRTVICRDLTTEDRPELRDFAREVVAATSIRAGIAYALQLHQRLVGVLNVYFDAPLDCDSSAPLRAAAIADHAALVLGNRELEQRSEHLETALQNSRTIGAAIGILVERHKLTPDAAFEQLRAASQNGNRKLSAVADHLLATGEVPT